MKLQKFRFKKEFFNIDGIYNVPGLVINSGHGYNFKTYCCNNCGEIFVTQLESFYNQNFTEKKTNENCPKCNIHLEKSLVDYPENIFYENRILKNNHEIDRKNFEYTEILEAYLLI